MGDIGDRRIPHRLKTLPTEEPWLSQEKSGFCAKGNGELWQIGAGEGPASGKITPPVWGRMDRRAHGETDDRKSGLAGTDRKGCGCLVPRLSCSGERSWI